MKFRTNTTVRKSVVDTIDEEPVDMPMAIPHCLIALEFPQNVPLLFERVLHAYKIIGNKWCTSIELSLEAMNAGYEPDGLDEINILRVLHYLGYLDIRTEEQNRISVNRYRLSKKTAEKLGVKEAFTNISDTFCIECDGVGNLIGGVCSRCNGTGLEKLNRKSLPEKIKPMSTKQNCVPCDGLGIDNAGGLCIKCDGTGTVKATKIRRK